VRRHRLRLEEGRHRAALRGTNEGAWETSLKGGGRRTRGVRLSRWLASNGQMCDRTGRELKKEKLVTRRGQSPRKSREISKGQVCYLIYLYRGRGQGYGPRCQQRNGRNLLRREKVGGFNSRGSPSTERIRDRRLEETGRFDDTILGKVYLGQPVEGEGLRVGGGISAKNAREVARQLRPL